MGTHDRQKEPLPLYQPEIEHNAVDLGEVTNGVVHVPVDVKAGRQLVVHTSSNEPAITFHAPSNLATGTTLEVPAIQIEAKELAANPGGNFKHRPKHIQNILPEPIPAFEAHSKCSVAMIFDRRPPYHLGENITGKVVIKAFQAFKAKKVLFEVEQVCTAVVWSQRGFQQKETGGYNVKDHEQKNQTKRVQLTLSESQQLEEGEHVIPFSFTLPAESAGSLSGGWDKPDQPGVKDVRYSCEWYARTIVKRRGVKSSICLNRKLRLNGATTPPAEMVQPFSLSRDLPLYRFLVLNRGLMKLSLKFGQLRAFRKEAATTGCYVAGLMSLKLENFSQTTLRQIKFQLKEHVCVLGKLKQEVTVGQSSITAWLGPSNTPKTEEEEGEGGEQLLATLEKQLVLKFPMPNHITSSSDPFVVVQHEIEVSMDIWRAKAPVIRIPITIHA